MYLWEVLGEHGRTGTLQRMWPGLGSPCPLLWDAPQMSLAEGARPASPAGRLPPWRLSWTLSQAPTAAHRAGQGRLCFPGGRAPLPARPLAELGRPA